MKVFIFLKISLLLRLSLPKTFQKIEVALLILLTPDIKSAALKWIFVFISSYDLENKHCSNAIRSSTFIF